MIKSSVEQIWQRDTFGKTIPVETCQAILQSGNILTFILRKRKCTDLAKQEITNEENYTTALCEEDPNVLAQYILFTINKNLNEQSKLRKVKVKDPVKDIFFW